jgi:hypothetical protein
MRPLGAFGLLLFLALARPAVAADDLGRLEREALEDALRARGLVVDPAPEGKTIGQVHVVNHEVFSARDWYFQLLNMFHRTTREPLIRREALFGPGQPYRPELIAETRRNLQNPDLSSVVVVVPVVSAAPGTVDVLIVTRDVWSLRLNTDFQLEQGNGQARLLSLTSSLSENNLFGWRKQASFYFDLDQGAIALGPTYIDRNIAGTRLTLTASARALFSREGFRSEGSTSNVALRYPLWALSRRWGAAASAGHTDRVVRTFQGHNLRPVDFTSTPDVKERYPWIYRLRTFGTGASVTRSFGAAVIQRVSLSHGYSVVRPSFTPDFPLDDQARAEFARQIFPRSERVSSVGLVYSLFTPRYVTYRDLDTFDLREDRVLGPSASANLSRAARALGSDRDFYGLGAGAGWTFGWLGGLQGISAGWSSRIEGGRLTDQAYSANAYQVSPVLRRVGRLIATIGAGAVVDDTRSTFYYLGVDNGLRGYAVGDLFGKAWMAGHLEARSMALSVATFRLGGLVFYDLGDAASPDPGTGAGVVRAARAVLGLHPKHDVGLGLRLLIPQLNAYVIRLDWAVPFQSAGLTRAGLPGRFFVGFGQAI